MGGIAKAVGKIAAPVMTGGLSLLGKPLGLSLEDEQGEYLTPEQKAQKEAQQYYANYDKNMGEATKGVQEGAFTKGLFGADGVQSQLQREGTDLSSRGYSLQPEDYEAYGQTAGDVSRMFGQQNQAAASELARRGLGSASSGAAGAKFAGLQGNKNEMLARAQTNIAQKRMENTRQRLNDNRVMQSQLANQGVGMASDNFARKGGSLQQAASSEQGMNEQNRQTLADKEAAVRPGLFSTIGQGLQRGIGQMAQAAPGMAVGGFGGAASSMGNPLAQKNKYGVDGAGGTTSMSSDYLNMRERR